MTTKAQQQPMPPFPCHGIFPSGEGRMTRRRAMRLTRWIANVSFLACLGPANAQTIEEICNGDVLLFEPPGFAHLDKNGDRALDADEASNCEALSTVFETLDLDSDQTLTESEYRSFAVIWRQRAQTFGRGQP